MGKLSRTWSLMRSSWEVLKKDKQLLFFPLLSAVCSLIVIASFAFPFIFSNFIEPTSTTLQIDSSYYVLLFLFYFVLYFVVIFFNSAIVANAFTLMKGGTPRFSDGIRIAFSRLPQIFGWAFISATVGVILRMIQERVGWLGKVLAGILGIAFSLVSFLVVPILVVEKKGPIESLKESTSLFKKTWGEQISGTLGFGLIFFLLSLPAIIFIPISISIFSDSFVTIIATISIVFLYLMALTLIQSTLQSIFQAALYLYAKDSQIPEGFQEESLAYAITRK
jgi:hypothetical protein